MISDRHGVDHRALAREMEDLYYRRARYHPSRWYTLPANFRGAYVHTDQYGFRIKREANRSGLDAIALFGGSTMFSTTTRQEGSIASALGTLARPDTTRVLNYGVGGYSSFTELPTFVEALRIDTKTRVAVFYDGVNEVGRHLELVQDDPGEATYDFVGYPFAMTLRVALRNELGGIFNLYRPRMLTLSEYLTSYFAKMRGQSKLSSERANKNEMLQISARQIVERYVENIRDIEAVARRHDVVPVFLWQPDIFLTRKTLTAREDDLMKGRPQALRDLTLAVHALIKSDGRLKQMRFFDVSDVLDDMEGEQFFDYCHVSEEANALIARRIASLLRDSTPVSYWRQE